MTNYIFAYVLILYYESFVYWSHPEEFFDSYGSCKEIYAHIVDVSHTIVSHYTHRLSGATENASETTVQKNVLKKKKTASK